MFKLKMGETKITESQLAAILLNMAVFSVPFFDINISKEQMIAGSQVAATVLIAISAFAIKQRKKQKESEK